MFASQSCACSLLVVRCTQTNPLRADSALLDVAPLHLAGRTHLKGKAAHRAISRYTVSPSSASTGGAGETIRTASARARSRIAAGTSGAWSTRSAWASARAWRSVRSSGSGEVRAIAHHIVAPDLSGVHRPRTLALATRGCRNKSGMTRGSSEPPSPATLADRPASPFASGYRAQYRARISCSRSAKAPRPAGNIASNRCRSAAASPAETPPVPTATITGERSTIAGSVKSHRSEPVDRVDQHAARLEPRDRRVGIVHRDDRQRRLGILADDHRARALEQPPLRVRRLAIADQHHRPPLQPDEDRQAVQAHSHSGTRSSSMIVLGEMRSATTA